jgi:hypothetical protein
VFAHQRLPFPSPYPRRPSLHGEQTAKSVNCFRMSRRPDPREVEMLTKENLAELRHNLAHLSLHAVREFYDRAHQVRPRGGYQFCC